MRVGHRSNELFDARSWRCCAPVRPNRRTAPRIYRVPLATRHEQARRLLVNVATTPLRDCARGDRRHDRHRRRHLDPRAARRAAADFGEDGVHRSSCRGRRARSQHAADRHFELHADAPRGCRADDPKTKVLEKIERQTFRAAKIVNGLLNLARPAQVDSGPCDINAVINDVLSLLEHQFTHRTYPGAQGIRNAGPVVLRASSTSCSRCS